MTAVRIPGRFAILRSLRRLVPCLRGLWRSLCWIFWLLYFGFIGLVLALRYAVLPQL